MTWVVKAEGGTRAADRDEIRRALSVLIEPGQTFELRGLPSGRSKVCRGSDIEAATEAAFDLSDGHGVYWTLNPCRPDLDKAASNGDILHRRWLLIDCDAVRPADVSATASEKDAAIDLACEIAEYLSGLGWPDAVWIDSGNGGHLLYPIDLPADKLSQQLVKGVLCALGDRFDNDRAKVDRAVHNAARISKLPGTWVRKGVPTEERPHRMSRLVKAPEHAGEIVTPEMMRALASPPKAEANDHNPWAVKATGGNGLERYVRSAIERECARVVMATEGGRNNTLNTAAFNLATMAGWPEMDASDAKIALYQAAKRAGLSEHETKLTIESGWGAGSRETRKRPEESASTNGGQSPTKAETPPEPPGRLIILASEVQPKKVHWLWPDRVAVGFISLFAGQTGIGKSFVALDFAARLTTGRPLPVSGIKLPKGRVLMISEDPYDYVLAPRLREMEADLDAVAFMSWEAMAAFTLSNMPMLTRAWEQAGSPQLLIIDPPANFLGGRNEHKNAEIRQVLMGLVAWLNEKQVACVMITHLRKASADPEEVLDRIMGSVAWASTSRVAVAFTRDEDNPNQCLMPGVKNNVGATAETLIYQITKTDTLAVVTWIGKSDKNATEAFQKPAKRKTVGASAAEWVTERFREQYQWESNELRRLANEAGVSTDAVFKGAEVNALPIDKRPRNNPDGTKTWMWSARPGWPPEKRSESTERTES